MSAVQTPLHTLDALLSCPVTIKGTIIFLLKMVNWGFWEDKNVPKVTQLHQQRLHKWTLPLNFCSSLLQKPLIQMSADFDEIDTTLSKVCDASSKPIMNEFLQ